MMNHKQKRDDVASRLFFLLKEVYGFDVKKINMLKHNVWMVAAREGCWVVKKYRTFFEAMKQAMLMQSLRQMGFRHVPAVYTAIGQHGVFFFAGRFWLTQTYISGAKMLSFTEKKDIAAGLQLLQTYHSVTDMLLSHPIWRMTLPYYHLYRKWQRRYEDFYIHLPLIEKIMEKEDIAFTMQYAEYCLSTCANYISSLARERVAIIHGDIAAHNFLRTKKGKVYLIDYDAAAIASPAIDYLQYASRILPHLQWSFSDLSRFSPFSDWLAKPWFLHALLFPADIFREWRFALKYNRRLAIARKERESFVHKIVSMLK
ncbi:phosphotransferase [Saccharococcus caldoxylosilyticus]|uniref:Putative aminoglycoside phosphotransferase n=1 Tax=Parageobacillus caldoxylosilyticus NBRC 107762 TaxID=1220594 RepID=A0A023DB75_9BACL|nr:phosphotransferase [Parageobacillus caldoxylosilyticus]MBB3850896.1 serine/threonine protein kinase [Parageobacillus caldoxylosilyticus]GAJ38211.1 putative aminoglycoside phosphotransferase [Parageobacillus caldoxylosilyticus NBRC 107762]